VTVPDELGDRPAHRVADDDRRPDVELDEGRGDVVGAVLQREPLRATHAASVTAVIDAHDVELLAECGVRTAPVEIGRRSPSVQQDDGHPPPRAAQVADESASAPGKVEVAARRQPHRASEIDNLLHARALTFS
jgi:hypothetical protein